jgi:uncharacterized protein
MALAVTDDTACGHAVSGFSAPTRRAELWVVVEVTEAYVHCRKHIPRMQRLPQKRAWGSDDPARKGGDYFGARAATDPAAGAIPAPRAPLDGNMPTPWNA